MWTNTLVYLLYFTGVFLISVDSQNVEAEVGQDITLVCPLTGSFPEWHGPLDWILLNMNNQDAALANRLQYVNDKDLLITNVTTMYTGEYRCKQGSQESSVTLVVNSLNPTVQILGVMDGVLPADSSVMVLPLRTNTSETVVCMVWNTYPQPTSVTITADGRDTVGVKKLTIHQNNTITVTLTAFLTVDSSYDMKAIVCEATVEGQKTNATETIKVVREPTLFVRANSGDHSSTRNKGNFSCDALVSWPTTSFTWNLTDVDNDPARFTIHPTKCIQRSTDLSYNCSSEVEARDLTKADNGRVLTCDIFFLGRKLETYSMAISFMFPPTKANITGPDVIESEDGNTVTLTCTTDSLRRYNNSQARFTWMVQDHEINPTIISTTNTPGAEYNAYTSTQKVSFPVQKSMNGKEVTCNAEDVQDSKLLDVKYSPSIIRPTSMTAYVYTGDTLEVGCTADSNPTSTISWTRNGNVATVKDIDPDDNMASLYIENIQASAEGQYTCTADNGVVTAASKTINIEVYDKPNPPPINVDAISEDSAEVQVTTSSEAPTVPRYFYVQFKPSSSQQWLNIDEPIQDTYSGGSSRTETIKLPSLLPGTAYELRIKSVDENQLYFYSDTNQFTTSAKDENMKTEKEFTTAILVSVFVTFGVMLAILVIVVIVMRKHGSSSF